MGNGLYFGTPIKGPQAKTFKFGQEEFDYGGNLVDSVAMNPDAMPSYAPSTSPQRQSTNDLLKMQNSLGMTEEQAILEAERLSKNDYESQFVGFKRAVSVKPKTRKDMLKYLENKIAENPQDFYNYDQKARIHLSVIFEE